VPPDVSRPTLAGRRHGQPPVYNWVGLQEQIVESTEPITAGHQVLSATFEREGDTMPAEGTLTLHIGTTKVGEGRIKTQPGKFSIAGKGPTPARTAANRSPMTTPAPPRGRSSGEPSSAPSSTSAAIPSSTSPARRQWPSHETEPRPAHHELPTELHTAELTAVSMISAALPSLRLPGV
jgi:hypothetical protein